MRRRARVDANHGEVLAAFRRLGFSVADTSRLGEGFPDCVIAKHMRTALVEIKDGSNPPSARRLTKPEVDFKAVWLGTYLIVESLDDVLDVSKSWGNR